MSEVRILVQGVAKDHDAFVAYMERVTTDIEREEPGTVLMEVFVDRETGQAVLDERYFDGDAFMAHSKRLMDGLEEFLQVFDFKRMTFLSGTEDERVAEVARQFSANVVSQVAGFDRRSANA